MLAEPETRGRILRRFEAWLDQALAAEEPPEGLAAEILEEQDPEARTPDLYSLWSAMTAFTQEVKLQGRAFRQLHQALEPAAAAFTEAQRIAGEAERRVRKSTLDALLDLRDRLTRGLDSARAAASRPILAEVHWMDRLRRRKPAPRTAPALEAVAAIESGYRLALERLDQLLEEWRVREIRCLGEPFNPRSMNAIEAVASAEAEGTILEVYRAGYEWNGEVYRTAQVKVARPKSRVEVSDST